MPARAAPTALSAASQAAEGGRSPIGKIASTPSPMNFSTSPPKAWTAPATRSNQASSAATTASGAVASDSSVKQPGFRLRRGAAREPSRAPGRLAVGGPTAPHRRRAPVPPVPSPSSQLRAARRGGMRRPRRGLDALSRKARHRRRRRRPGTRPHREVTRRGYFSNSLAVRIGHPSALTERNT